MANLLFATCCCLMPAIFFAIFALMGAAKRVGEHGTYRYEQPRDDTYLQEAMPWYTTNIYPSGDDE